MDYSDLERLKKLYKQYLSDINIAPNKGKTRHETAWDLAYKRYRQAKNNELALSLAPTGLTKDEEKLPPRPNLQWKDKTRRWVSAKNNPLKILYAWKKKLDRESKKAAKEGNYNLYEKLNRRVDKVSEKLDEIDFPEIINKIEKQQRAKRITPIKHLTPLKRPKQQTASTTAKLPDGESKTISAKSNLNLYKPPKLARFRPGDTGLVEREITVRRKDGTTYKRKQKVRPENV